MLVRSICNVLVLLQAVGNRELFTSCDMSLAVFDSNLFRAKISKVVKGAERLSAYNDVHVMKRAL